MPKIYITTRVGTEIPAEGDAGISLMEVIRNAGFGELAALCGGSCSCATCHVYISPDFKAQLPQMTEDENDLLEGVSHRTEDSRLSCQIEFDKRLDGLKVTIAPEE